MLRKIIFLNRIYLIIYYKPNIPLLTSIHFRGHNKIKCSTPPSPKNKHDGVLKL